MPRNKVSTGAVIRKRPRGQPEVAELLSNRTVIATMVDPATVNTSAKMTQCGSISSVVETFQPTIQYQVTARPELAKGNEAEQVVEAVMHYGKEDPANVVMDFSQENLICNVRVARKDPARTEIDSRPLLKLRLQSLILGELTKNLESTEAKSLLEGDRSALLAWIDKQVESLQALLAARKDTEEIEQAKNEELEGGHE